MLHWGPIAAYAALIFYLSSLSTVPLPPGLQLSDKALHLFEYGAFGGLMTWALLPRQWSRVGLLAAATVAGSLYGASDELHQLFTPGRSAEVLDWVADTAGSFLGAWGATRVFATRSRA